MTTRSIVTAAICLALAGGCRPKDAPENAATVVNPVGDSDLHPACVGVDDEVASDICLLVPSWQELDLAWIDASNVILVATLREFDYPCEFHDDGSSDMILGRAFEVRQVLRGEIEAREVDISQVLEGDVPDEFVDGRRYLVMLAADEQTLERLASPDTVWNVGNEPHASEVVAIVDLTQSFEEAEALATKASRSGEHAGLAFGPDAWEALRSADENDVENQALFLDFISSVVLVEGATLKQVREWLGEPDWWWMNEDGISHRWNLHGKVATDPTPGMIAVRLETWFDSDLVLVSWRVEVTRCIRADETGDAWEMLEPAEFESLGLTPLSGP